MVVVHSQSRRSGDPAFDLVVERASRLLGENEQVASVAPPRPGYSISADRHTAIVSARARGDTTEMVAAAAQQSSYFVVECRPA